MTKKIRLLMHMVSTGNQSNAVHFISNAPRHPFDAFNRQKPS
jgi:hypothetical protein